MDNNVFEQSKKINEYGAEYWTARDLYKILEYAEYRNILPVLEKAKEAAKNSGAVVHNHFVDINEMVTIGSGAQRERDNVILDRYACYLIVQNSDPSKEIVALGQTYFAIQTRRQEAADSLLEDRKRVMLRDEVTKHNASLASSAKEAGVADFARFQNAGYQGLYGGMSASQIKQRKKLKKSQQILDHMGSEELAANLFRATQADAKLKREGIRGEYSANLAHYEVGRKVRKTIKDLGGTMPENLPTPDGIGRAKTRIKSDDKRKLKESQSHEN